MQKRENYYPFFGWLFLFYIRRFRRTARSRTHPLAHTHTHTLNYTQTGKLSPFCDIKADGQTN